MMLFKHILKKLIVAPGYIANYGYTDGSGNWYVIIDTGKCNGCGKCVEACPSSIIETIADDYDDIVAQVKEAHRKNIKYVCGPCKDIGGEGEKACVVSCPSRAITLNLKSA